MLHFEFSIDITILFSSFFLDHEIHAHSRFCHLVRVSLVLLNASVGSDILLTVIIVDTSSILCLDFGVIDIVDPLD